MHEFRVSCPYFGNSNRLMKMKTVELPWLTDCIHMDCSPLRKLKMPTRFNGGDGFVKFIRS